jgi:hypothetical protein
MNVQEEGPVDSGSGVEQPRPLPKLSRRWLKITLRGTLILLAVIACGFGWLASHVHRARQEGRIIAELKAAHGLSMNVTLANPFDSDQPEEFARFDEGGPKWLTNLLGADIFRATVGITCYGRGNSFASAVDATGKFYWKRNYVAGITTDELELVSKLPYVNRLYLEANPVDDDGVAEIVRLRRLDTLNLSHTAITDAAVATLANAGSLKHLDLSYTDITNRALESLATFRHLESLNLKATRLSADRINILQQQLPDCEITRSDP